MTREEKFYQLFEIIHQKSLREMLKELEGQITRTQLGALYHIEQIEPCNAKNIAEKLGIKPSSVTVMLDRLEELGWIERTNDAQDRRAVWVRIRPQGKQLLDQARQLRQKTMGQLLNKLPESKQHELIAIFETLLNEELENDRN